MIDYNATIISDRDRRSPTIAQKRPDGGILLQAGRNVIYLSDAELKRLSDFADKVPVMTAVSPAKARFA